MNIYFIGYRGSGKTTLGKILSRKWDRPFTDTDMMIVQKENRSVPEIFQTDGEDYFRKIEKKVLEEVSRLDRTFISTGGGIVLDPDNRKRLKETGRCVYLAADAQTIYRRTYRDGNRPALTHSPLLDEIRDLLLVREPLYRSLADLTLDTSKSGIDECVEILKESELMQRIIENG